MAVAAHAQGNISVLTVDGVLDSSTYRQLRDSVIKVALEQPRAVIVDVTELDVPAESAWSVFTSARWHVTVWPGVPVVLVCRLLRGRDALLRNGITRRVPVYPTLDSARAAIRDDDAKPPPRRAHAQLPAVHSSLRRARALLTEWLMAWSVADLIPVASVVLDVFATNVLEHTQSPIDLLVESTGSTVTIAVEDASRRPAALHEDSRRGGGAISGLAVVAALARNWGSAPTPTGKTVWAIIGPENSL